VADVAGAADTSNRTDAFFYLSGKAERNFNRTDHEVDGSEASPSVDALITSSIGQFRGLAEYLLTDDEHDLERFELGWAPDEDTMVWIGRYHRPYSYGNTLHHHGQYLQTTIERPALEEWEDDDGYLPAHATGLLMETHQTSETGSGLHVALAAGAGTVLDENGLKPFDVLHPESGHDLGGDLRVAYLPDALGENSIGASVSYSKMECKSCESSAPPLSDLYLGTASGYVDWRLHQWHLLSTVIYARGELNHTDGSSSDQSFWSGYAQVEFAASDRWTAYVRQENRWGDRNSEYLTYFRDSISQASIAGIRFEFLRRQALTLELSREHSPADDFSKIAIQWSALVP
jgi:hypothetical protein